MSHFFSPCTHPRGVCRSFLLLDRRIGIAAVLAVAVIIGASACYVIYNGSERPSIEAVLSEEEHARGLVMSVIGME